MSTAPVTGSPAAVAVDETAPSSIPALSMTPSVTKVRPSC